MYNKFFSLSNFTKEEIDSLSVLLPDKEIF